MLRFGQPNPRAHAFVRSLSMIRSCSARNRCSGVDGPRPARCAIFSSERDAKKNDAVAFSNRCGSLRMNSTHSGFVVNSFGSSSGIGNPRRGENTRAAATLHFDPHDKSTRAKIPGEIRVSPSTRSAARCCTQKASFPPQLTPTRCTPLRPLRSRTQSNCSATSSIRRSADDACPRASRLRPLPRRSGNNTAAPLATRRDAVPRNHSPCD